jgi:hypothetical protein
MKYAEPPIQGLESQISFFASEYESDLKQYKAFQDLVMSSITSSIVIFIIQWFTRTLLTARNNPSDSYLISVNRLLPREAFWQEISEDRSCRKLLKAVSARNSLTKFKAAKILAWVWPRSSQSLLKYRREDQRFHPEHSTFHLTTPQPWIEASSC